MTKSSSIPLYRRHRFPPDVMAHVVWLYFRFPLSLRMVEDLLAQRGIIVSHQTVRTWAEKFGWQFAGQIRRRSAGRLGDKWHLDDSAARQGFAQQKPERVVITIAGKKHWLWRAYDAAKRDVMPGVEHHSDKGLNNRAENSHQPLRRRERIMKGFK